MIFPLAKRGAICLLTSLFLGGCSVAKLEARLEANPQCKDVINPKTGAVMPCPGTDKSFYRSVGLEPAKTTTVVAPSASSAAVATSTVTAADTNIKSAGSATVSATPASNNPTPALSTPVDCKPQIHKKTGGMLPCPNPD
jgi:hypothetical protein